LNKKLWALNLLLLAAIALIGREWQQNYKAAREREQKMLGKKIQPSAVPPITPAPLPPAVQAVGYVDVAQQMLFSKDRNPNVVIEQEKPKPLPIFPRFFGVMNLGDGPMAILKDGQTRQQPYKPGDKVGEFQLTEIGPDTLVFEWEKKKYPKKFSELQEKSAEPEAAPQRAAAASAPAPTPPPPPGRSEPGVDIGGGVSACVANDPSPAGTVSGGKRKVISDSPFGKVCRWEPVK
jgi:hypothetical protein